MARYIQAPQQQYVSQYVPKDLNFYQQQIDKSQARYDATQAMYSEALGALGELEAYDQDAKNELLNSFVGGFDNLYTKYQGDLSKATGEMMGLVGKIKGDPKLALIKEQTRQGRMLDQMIAQNPNLYVLEDPRNKKINQIASTQDLSPVVVDPTEINKTFLGMNQHIANQKREGDIKIDASTGKYYRDTVLGATQNEVTQMLQDPNTYESVYKNYPELSARRNDPKVQQLVQSIVQQSAQQLIQGNIKSDLSGNHYTDLASRTTPPAISFNTPMETTTMKNNFLDTSKLEKNTSNIAKDISKIPWALSPSPKFSGNNVETVQDGYGSLNEDELAKFNNVASTQFGITGKKKLSDYSDTEITQIKTFIDKAFSPEAVATFVHTIPNTNIYNGSDKKGAEGLTDIIFGGGTVEDAKRVGWYKNLKFIDTETGKIMQGKDFGEEVLGKLDAGNSIRVQGELSYNNPYTKITDDYAFSNGYQVTIGNKDYIMTSPQQQLIDTPGGKYNLNTAPEALNRISNMAYTPGYTINQELPVNNNRLDGKNINLKTDISYVKGEYILKLTEGNSGITAKGKTPEQAYKAYRVALGIE